MSDRYSSITLILDKDIRDDDAESLLLCLKYIRGVVAVKPNITEGFDELTATVRGDLRWRRRIIDLLSSSETTP